VKVLINILGDMELRKPLYYFTVPGIVFSSIGIFLGLSFLQRFYRGESLSFGLTLLMVMMTLIGVFMAFTGIILHTMSRLINESRKKEA